MTGTHGDVDRGDYLRLVDGLATSAPAFLQAFDAAYADVHDLLARVSTSRFAGRARRAALDAIRARIRPLAADAAWVASRCEALARPDLVALVGPEPSAALDVALARRDELPRYRWAAAATLVLLTADAHLLQVHGRDLLTLEPGELPWRAGRSADRGAGTAATAAPSGDVAAIAAFWNELRPRMVATIDRFLAEYPRAWQELSLAEDDPRAAADAVELAQIDLEATAQLVAEQWESLDLPYALPALPRDVPDPRVAVPLWRACGYALLRLFSGDVAVATGPDALELTPDELRRLRAVPEIDGWLRAAGA